MADMREGITIFKELIRLGNLQRKIWHDNCLDQLENSEEFTDGDYIVGKIHFGIEE